MRLTIKFVIASALFGMTATANASETQYRYDTLGRIVRAGQSAPGTANTSRYGYDRAGNRVSHVVEGSSNGSITGGIVLPLGDGFVVVPIDRQ